MKIIEKEFDAMTNKETITERNATADEISAMEKAKTEMADFLAKQKIAEAAKAVAHAKLTALGLTVDDLKALGL